MSWLQWNGQLWEANKDEATFNVFLRSPDAGGKRFVWIWYLFHNDRVRHPDRDPPYRYLSVELMDLGFSEDWRQLSRRVIRSSPAWQAEHEELNQYGLLSVPHIAVDGDWLQGQMDDDYAGSWKGDHFILRIGERDGYTFPCELDAWVQPEREYERTLPETPEELARGPTGEPNLRVITRARIGKANVQLPRCGNDPLPLARKYLEELTGLADMPVTDIDWWGPKPAHGKEAKALGWRCEVKFELPE